MGRDRTAAVGATQFLLLLQSLPHVGEKTLTEILRRMARERLSPDAYLALGMAGWQTRFGLDERAALALAEGLPGLLEWSAEASRLLRAHRLELLSLASATYPERLSAHGDPPPPLLFALGALSMLKREPGSFTFTLACSNGAPAAALRTLDELASELSGEGGIPVTGHDRSAYQRAALAAQRLNRPTIYVFDRGLREALGPGFDRPPFSAARIRETEFNVSRDLALSPFRLDDHGTGANNRRRDRIIFDLADIVVALHVRPDGAMHAECLRALRGGRPVFVLSSSTGGPELLAAGARPVPDDPSRAIIMRGAVIGDAAI